VRFVHRVYEGSDSRSLLTRCHQNSNVVDKRAVFLAVVAVNTRCEIPFTTSYVSQIVIRRVSFQPPTFSAIGASNLRQHRLMHARGVIGRGNIGV